MFAKVAIVVCVIELAHCGGLQNHGIENYAGDSGYAPGYADYGAGYAGFGAGYAGYGAGYSGYGAGYPGYGSNLYAGLKGGVATSYVNFNKYTAPGYNSYSGINGLPYGSRALYGATNGLYNGYSDLGYSGYAGTGYGGYPGYGYAGYNNAYAHNNIW